jgi:glutaredoxin
MLKTLPFSLRTPVIRSHCVSTRVALRRTPVVMATADRPDIDTSATPIGDVPRVAVLTTAGCAYCRRAKTALAQAGVPFQEIDLSSSTDVLEAVKQTTGRPTVPQVFISGQLIGGATELLHGLEDGTLSQLIARAESSGSPALPFQVEQALRAGEGGDSTSSASNETARAEAESLQVLKTLAEEMQQAGVGTADSRPFPGAFRLRQGVERLQVMRGMTVEEAIDVIGKMQATQIVTLVNGSDPQTTVTAAAGNLPPETAVLRWVSLCPWPSRLDQSLNAHFRWFGPARPGVEVSADLRSAVLGLYGRHMTEDGRKINYKAMSQDPDFKSFVTAAAELQAVDVRSLDREQGLSFWINVYNALIVHATATFGPATNALARLRWFDGVSYEIGGYKFSANDIEHGVLRGNAPSPASPLSLLGFGKWARKTFASDDPRLSLSCATVDPRIHFALNCGASSCPPIRVYTPERLEAGLQAAAVGFCSEEVKIIDQNGPDNMTLELSSIFKW